MFILSKNKLYQEDNNYIDKCLEGYYEEDNFCKKCNEEYITCDKGSSNDSLNYKLRKIINIY